MRTQKSPLRIIKEPYEVNLIRAVGKIEQEANKLGLTSSFRGTEINVYLNRIRGLIPAAYPSLCKSHEMQRFTLEQLRHWEYFPIPPFSGHYQAALALELLSRDGYEIKAVLNYNKKIFDRNPPKVGMLFINFLQHWVLMTMKDLALVDYNDRLDQIMQWIMSEKRSMLAKKQHHDMSSQCSPITHLKDIVEPTDYDFLFAYLINKKFVNKDTNYWTDSKKGTQGMLIELLKRLPGKGYIMGNQKLTNQEIKNVALNTFGIELNINYIRKINISDPLHRQMEILPAAPSREGRGT
jgi:hypothetical protein